MPIFQTGTGFNIYANIRAVNNQVTPVISFDENLIRTTTYTNVNGNYNVYIGANISRDYKLDTIHSIKPSFGGFASMNRVVSFNNEEKFSSKFMTISPSFGFTYT
jgi:hypothetical protein